jgi:hypothetical protein
MATTCSLSLMISNARMLVEFNKHNVRNPEVDETFSRIKQALARGYMAQIGRLNNSRVS